MEIKNEFINAFSLNNKDIESINVNLLLESISRLNNDITNAINSNNIQLANEKFIRLGKLLGTVGSYIESKKIIPNKLIKLSSNDEACIMACDIKLRKLARDLISKVRLFYPSAGLKFHPDSNKYVDENNLWVIIPQNTIPNLKIIVYGQLSDHNKGTRLTLQEDRPSYTTFQMNKPDQLREAISIIKHAYYLKNID